MDVIEQILEERAALTAAAAGVAPLAPPADWFAMEEPDEPTPMTVDDDGRVYGHAALWPTCHTGFMGKCVQPPKSNSGYAYFHLGEVLTAEGDRVHVGKITMDTGHANIQAGAQAALSHYDNTGTTAAYVRARDGKHGIWVSGAVRPDAPAEKAAALRGSSVSGDWRRPRPGSPLEMIGLLAVNVPGFPVPRTQAMTASGELIEDAENEIYEEEEMFAMTAAGVPEPVVMSDEQIARRLDILAARANGLDFLADLVFRPEELAMRALSAATGKPMVKCGSCSKMVADGRKCSECGDPVHPSTMDKTPAAYKKKAVTASGFDPTKHPREPSGSRAGGRWAFKTGDRVIRTHDKTAAPRRGTVVDTLHGGTKDERAQVKWDGQTTLGGYYSKGELSAAKPIMTPLQEYYPPEQGGHARGWGLGPEYKMKEDQIVGRPGGVQPAATRDIRGPKPGDYEGQARAAEQSAAQNRQRASELRQQGNHEHAQDYETAAERADKRAAEIRARIEKPVVSRSRGKVRKSGL
jgi:hypothetical protein